MCEVGADAPVPPPVAPRRKSGAEPVLDGNGHSTSTLLDFWRWAYSGTLDNALRGVLAEYLVGLAVDGLRDNVRVEWDSHDLTTPDQVKLEVKSAAYLQSWRQRNYSRITFHISETFGWTAASNEYSEVAGRQADVYVFCLFTARDRTAANPLDSRQWRFFVTSTEKLNREVGGQKTIMLGSLLERVKPEETTFDGLAEAVRRAAGLAS